MKTPNLTFLSVVGLGAATALVASLSLPAHTAAFSTIGGSLSTSQRDFRVFNNFTDTQANNNTSPHANFPGYTGAIMSIWKGHVEWASEPYNGNGLGDGVSSNINLGDGGANFDNTFQGTHTAAGGNNGNVHSEEAGSSGSTLAYTITPISDGWTIHYLSSWTWQDGPGSVTSGVDLQGVACHEIGHSLGLGHSSASGATMQAAISGSGTAQRSISSDDIAGVQSIYGLKSAGKPHISSISGSLNPGNSITIAGTGFSATGNEVWFTKLTNTNGDPLKVTGVSSSGGGTSITVTIPTGSVDGEILVKNSGSGNSSLSNAKPVDMGAPSGNPPLLTGVSPGAGAYSGFEEVTLTGTGLTGATSVLFNATPALGFTVVSDTTVDVIIPGGTLFETVDITLTDAEGSSTLEGQFFYSFNPLVDITMVTPNTGANAGGDRVTIDGVSVIGVDTVTFDGVPGTNLEIVDTSTLTVDTPAGSGTVDVVATGDSQDTIVGGFTYQDLGLFIEHHPGLGSLFGVPQLTGAGDLTPGSGTGFTTTTSGVFPLAPGLEFVSLAVGSAPFKGGTLYAFPAILSFSVAVDLVGSLVIPATIPVGIPSGTTIVLQQGFADGTATNGTTLTNGLECVVP